VALAELLIMKFASPEYIATIGSEVTGIVTEAEPPATVAVPRTAPVTVSMNFTVPVGVPDPGAITASVAFNVICEPLVVTERVVVTWAWLTVTVPPFTVELE
jgi:hypothetical protein